MACERSGRVRDAFRALGHDATSCDIEPTDEPGPHIQGDALPLLAKPWDLVIAFPPCTDLAWVNAQHLPPKRVDGRTAAGMAFFEACLNANAPKVAVENPRGVPCEVYPHYQVIQPWEYGHPYTKATCLWLRGLPPLMPTYSGQEEKTLCWTHPNGARKTARHRSETFPGIAQAMADQWG